jgi:hypothetical protein
MPETNDSASKPNQIYLLQKWEGTPEREKRCLLETRFYRRPSPDVESKFTVFVVKVTFVRFRATLGRRWQPVPLATARGNTNARSSGRRATIRELMPEDVRALSEAVGLPVGADDLAEVAHRINAFLVALAPLASLALDSAEPVPIAGVARREGA